MAGKTQGDRLHDLEAIVNKMHERLSALGNAVDASNTTQKEAGESQHQADHEIVNLKALVDELRRWTQVNGNNALNTDFAVLKERMGKLEAGQEKISNRFWTLAIVVVGAIVGAIVTFLARTL